MNEAKDKKNTDDWKKSTIKKAIEDAGWSFSQLSLANGLTRCTLAMALNKPYPNAERIIAKALGVTPAVIWPSRYDASGVSLQSSRRGPLPRKGNASSVLCNPQTAQAA